MTKWNRQNEVNLYIERDKGIGTDVSLYKLSFKEKIKKFFKIKDDKLEIKPIKYNKERIIKEESQNVSKIREESMGSRKNGRW